MLYSTVFNAVGATPLNVAMHVIIALGMRFRPPHAATAAAAAAAAAVVAADGRVGGRPLDEFETLSCN